MRKKPGKRKPASVPHKPRSGAKVRRKTSPGASLSKRLEKGRGPVRVTGKELAQLFAERAARRKERAQYKLARQSVGTYKVRKADKGKLIMVGAGGNKDPQARGKKGYAVYVTTTGKKRLLRIPAKEPFKARKLRTIADKLPIRRNLRRKIEAFQKKRLVTTAAGKGAIRGRSEIKLGGAWDFNNKAVTKLAKNLQKVVRAQRAFRVFNIHAYALIKLPGGGTESIEINVPIEKGDKDAIDLAGMENFIRQKFYAFLARQLAFHGLVSAGSANHIRSLAANQGMEKEEWVDKRGQPWAGADLEIVHILSLNWEIEQAK